MHVEKRTFADQNELYEALAHALESLLEGEDDRTAGLANASALLKLFLDEVNWVGFYLMKNNDLVLGPFQGRPAVVRIAVGKGVCGTAAAERKTQLVADVHKCENHIVCNAASASEIVVPILKDGGVLGVLDIDSPVVARFGPGDARGLEIIAALLARRLWR